MKQITRFMFGQWESYRDKSQQLDVTFFVLCRSNLLLFLTAKCYVGIDFNLIFPSPELDLISSLCKVSFATTFIRQKKSENFNGKKSSFIDSHPSLSRHFLHFACFINNETFSTREKKKLCKWCQRKEVWSLDSFAQANMQLLLGIYKSIKCIQQTCINTLTHQSHALPTRSMRLLLLIMLYIDINFHIQVSTSIILNGSSDPLENDKKKVSSSIMWKIYFSIA